MTIQSLRRRPLLLGLAAASMLRPPRVRAAATGPLRISNWPLYIGHTTVTDFEHKTGIDVEYVEDLNDNDSMFGKIAPSLRAGRNPDRDIIVPTDYVAARLIRLGWVERFSPTDVPNAKNLEPALAHPDWDPDRSHSLPWATYLCGIAYNVRKTGRELTSVKDLFDPAFRGHVSLLSQMRDTMATIFCGLGVDPAHADDAAFDHALAYLRTAVDSGQVRQFFGNDYGAALSRGDIWVALAWSGDVVQLQRDNPDLRFAIPVEGCYRAEDNMVIPNGTPHRDAALAWMNYIYDPANYAKITAVINYIPPVAGTREYVRAINPRLADSPLIYPSSEVLDRVRAFARLSPADEHRWNASFQALIGH